ncbi:hypothetical protein HK103_002678 [Boothiomyces macroporosus]|uniref:Splicing factor U2AF subunit n=1 Tax=Boothiomyces macroporosus TaxID=261099 RepID=A0AAD5UQ35_9FUNG|nr:hypothetical protein HK103_002678 [Boothiomyces macroporosus]
MAKFKFKGANFMKKKIGNTHPKDLIKTQRIFPGDLVQVVSGKVDVGKQGKVIDVLKDKNLIVVESIAMAVKHMKPNPFYPKGAKITKETPIHYSNVQLVDPVLNKPTKVKFERIHNPIKESTEYTRLALESKEYLPIPKKEDKFKKQEDYSSSYRGYDRGYRRDGRDRERRRSRSPRRSRQKSPDEPIPNLVPLHERPRKLNYWDQKPKGYEQLTADQAKATGTGSFGTPAVPEFGYGAIQYGAIAAIVDTSAGRSQKKLYFGDLPPDVTEEQVVEWVNSSYEKMGLEKGEGRPALNCKFEKNKEHCHVEFRTVDETTTALSLDGVEFKGKTIKVRRPKDYVPGQEDPNYVPGVVSNVVADTMFKVFIGGLPTYVTDDQVMELLTPFGELKSFNLVKDSNGVSKGFAFCEYLQPEITDLACEGLHGLELGDKKLIVQRASVGASKLPMIDGALPGAGLGRPILPIEILGANGMKPAEPTHVLMMLNMVTGDDLENDEDYESILEDIKLECETFGPISEIHIPRPHPHKFVAGVGKVFVKFENIKDCERAQRDLAGRRFNKRTVLTTFFDEIKLEARFF